MPAVVQIPQLPAATALNGTEQFEAVQAGVSVRVTTQQIANYAQSQVPLLVANLPTAIGFAGLRLFVSDATATTFDSIVAGSGSNKVPVFSDGLVWRIG